MCVCGVVCVCVSEREREREREMEWMLEKWFGYWCEPCNHHDVWAGEGTGVGGGVSPVCGWPSMREPK